MPRRLKLVLFALFAISGFSALTLQVVWQRVISMHAGVDLFSITTVVSAFLAGLGIGSLAGGWLADRLGPRRSLAAFAASKFGIGLFAWFSVWLFYDVYRDLASSLESTLAAFAFHFVLLVIPTVLMGLSLPLVARGIVERIADAPALVGRLYAVNTIGAGLGAAASGWILMGTFGFVGTVRLAAALNVVAAALVVTLWRAASAATPEPPAEPAPAEPAPGAMDSGDGEKPVWPWFVIYALTGAVALGLEVVFFRVVDALMRSNSYTFGHVLAIYLLLFGVGAAVASRFAGRTRQPERWFLGLQYGVGVAALAGLIVLVYGPDLLGVEGPLRRHFAIDGYNTGGYKFSPPSELARMAFVHLLGPLLIMGLPVLLMGASYPFAQALVARRLDTLGRQTGRLLFANIAGNVFGTLLVGFLLIDWLGTAGTMRLLAGVLLIPGIAAVRKRPRLVAGAAALMVGALAVFPSNRLLWVYFHSAQGKAFAVAEDRACVNTLRNDPVKDDPSRREDLLFVNAASQNAYPYDDFHVLIGLLPALMHDRPDQGMAVGLGIAATPYGMALDPRMARLDVVELCGGEVDLLRHLARQGSAENQRFLADERIDIHVGDGRKRLLTTKDRFDVMTVDVVRSQAAYSGSLYSVDFYELAKSRIAEGGLFAQWIATERAQNGVTEVFPYVLQFTVASYYGSRFLVAGSEPLAFDRATVLQRFDAIAGMGRVTLPPERLASIREFLATAEPVALRWGAPFAGVPGSHVNRDLFPRDEYFLNNPPVVPPRPNPPQPVISTR